MNSYYVHLYIAKIDKKSYNALEKRGQKMYIESFKLSRVIVLRSALRDDGLYFLRLLIYSRFMVHF